MEDAEYASADDLELVEQLVQGAKASRGHHRLFVLLAIRSADGLSLPQPALERPPHPCLAPCSPGACQFIAVEHNIILYRAA